MTTGGAESGPDTPLPAVALRPTQELKAFLRSDETFDDLAGWVNLRDPDGRAAVSLAMDLSAAPAPRPMPVIPILWTTYQFGVVGPLPLNAVRIAARVWENGGSGDTAPWGSELTPYGIQWAGRLLAAVRGLAIASGDPAGHRLQTEEDLAASAALVRFTVRAAFSPSGRRLLRTQRIEGDWQGGAPMAQISNWRLDDLIRERPGDHDRILAYVEERGTPRGRRGVETLRDWLDAGLARPVASGWL